MGREEGDRFNKVEDFILNSEDYEEILTPEKLLLLKDEFVRLKESCYLDHAGSSLYAKSQLDLAMTELQENLFSNPHSRNPSSSITTDATDHIRQRILQHFGTTENEYSVIFTSGATSSLKLVAESFSFNGGIFAYLEENHTSVVGMREYLLKNGSQKIPSTSSVCEAPSSSSTCNNGHVYCVSKSAMGKIMNSSPQSNNGCENENDVGGISNFNHGSLNETGIGSEMKNALYAFPAQCNFSGFKYPLDWIPKIHKGYLDSLHEADEYYIQDDNVQNHIKISNDHPFKWFVVLDAASYVASNKLDLSVHKPDFVAISFYKMFGWPTGIGALLVRNSSGYVLGNKQYFGGGTVNISLPSIPFHVKRVKLHERFEDGTISFLSILGLRHGFNALTKFFPTMDLIRLRTFRLTQYLFNNLRNMKYINDQKVAIIFSDTEYDSEKKQGPVVTFNLLRPNGEMIGYSEMEQIAYLHNVNLRYGCFCNPGMLEIVCSACRRHLGLSPEQVLKHYEVGHVCGDMRDIIDGSPTGAIRVSIGYMTNKENINFLLRLIFNCWIKPYNVNQQASKNCTLPVELSNNNSEQQVPIARQKLLNIFVYPIKSCGPFEVKTTWTLGSHGLLYDREWLIVNSNGVPLTAKREPRLCLIKPTIDISNRQLILNFQGNEEDSVVVPLDISTISRNYTIEAPLCNSKVCGDSIVGLDCGEEVSKWLCRILEKEDLKLIRMSPDHHRKPRNSMDEISLANQSQFLLLSMISLRQLARELISNKLLSSLNILTLTTYNDARKPFFSNRGESLVPSTRENSYCDDDGLYENRKVNGTCVDNCGQDDNAQAILEATVIDSLIGRFRANFVVDGLDSDRAYEEESWSGIRIGATNFKSGGPCIRCATICMDPSTGSKSSEPFLTLSRMRSGRPNFGIHLYATRFSDHNDNFIMGRRQQSFLQALRIGDHYLVVKKNGESASNIPSISSALEELRNID